MKSFMKAILSRRMLFIISMLMTILFAVVMFNLQILPLKYYIPLVVVFFVLFIWLYKVEKDKKKGRQIKASIFKCVQVLLIVVLAIGTLSALKGSNLLAAITGGADQVIEYSVVVLEKSSYNRLEDLEGKLIATQSNDAIQSNRALVEIEDVIGDVNTTSYDDHASLSNALLQSTVDSLLIKTVDYESYDDVYTDFTEITKVIHKVKITVPRVEATSANVTKEAFNVFISGMDQEGDISNFALSDVNMIATINPTTKQILLTSIPRDYFVDIIQNGVNIGKDKLTHSSKGGISTTIDTVENFLGIEINYYVKFNFTSFISIVDALGGITIDIPHYEVKNNDEGIFTTRKGKYTMKPGIMEMDAHQALCFVRERYSFVKGDVVRGQNQMLMLKAIIKKCSSPTIITKMDGVFTSLQSSFETNMTAREVKSLINMQISDMAGWDIQSYHLEGDASQRTLTLATVGDVSSVNPNGMYIMEPYLESIALSKSYIETIIEGKEILKVEQD